MLESRLGEGGGRERDGASGCPVALQKQLKTLTGIVQITVSDHQGIGTLGIRDREEEVCVFFV